MFGRKRVNKVVLFHVEQIEKYIEMRLKRTKCTKGEETALNKIKEELQGLKKEVEG